VAIGTKLVLRWGIVKLLNSELFNLSDINFIVSCALRFCNFCTSLVLISRFIHKLLHLSLGYSHCGRLESPSLVSKPSTPHPMAW